MCKEGSDMQVKLQVLLEERIEQLHSVVSSRWRRKEEEDDLLDAVLPCFVLLEAVELALCHHSQLTLWHLPWQ